MQYFPDIGYWKTKKKTTQIWAGHFQLGTFPEIIWGYLTLCILQCRKPAGHLCCKLYTASSSLSSSRFRGGMLCCLELMICLCVAVCCWIRATIHQSYFLSLRNWDVVYLISSVAIRRGPSIAYPYFVATRIYTEQVERSYCAKISSIHLSVPLEVQPVTDVGPTDTAETNTGGRHIQNHG